MTAEIISIGTELLLGDIVNTNAQYLAQGLAGLGIHSYWQTVVGDNPTRLAEALAHALNRSDIALLTGGLGPTYDDLTKETVAEYFGYEMTLHPESYEQLLNRFKRFNRPMTENNKKQAYMPVGATVFPNDRGTANGLAVEGKGKVVVMLPGPPREMTALFDLQVKPYLMRYSGAMLYSRTIHFFGIGESQLEQELHEYMLDHLNPTVAPYATEGEVKIRVTASANTPEEGAAVLQSTVDEIVAKYKNVVYGVDVGDLQTALVQELAKKGCSIATAESCTGGLISQRITAVSGASNVFGYGLCTYANEAKSQLLGVSEETLATYGAVSAQTAAEMAEGVRKLSGADIGLAVTGLAGPTGGTPEKPVGLVYVGVASEQGTQVDTLQLSRGYGGEREWVRYAASSHALHHALRVAEKLPAKAVPKEALHEKA